MCCGICMLSGCVWCCWWLILLYNVNVVVSGLFCGRCLMWWYGSFRLEFVIFWIWLEGCYVEDY